MDEQQHQKLIKIHRGIIIARWAWIIIGFFRGEIMRGFQNQELSPLTPAVKFGGISVMLYLAIFQIAFNFFLWLYLRLTAKKVSPSGFKILNFLQVYVDLFIFTLIFYFSGGLEGPGATMFFVPLIISLIVYRQAGIIAMTITGIVFFGTAVYTQYLSQFYSWIPHFHAYETLFHISENLFIINYVFSTFLMSYVGAAVFGSLVSRTLHKREEELVIERDKTSNILNNLSEGIVVYDQNDTLTFLNPKAEQILGANAKKIIDSKIDEKMKTDYPRMKDLLDLPPDNKSHELDYKNPEPLSLVVSSAPLSDLTGNNIGNIKILRDITREKTINRIKNEFISIVSHQLRTPLSAIKWTLKMLDDQDLGPLNTEQHDFINKSFRANEQMIKLVNDLLSVSRIEEGRFLYEFKIINLQDVTNEALDGAGLLLERMKTKNIEFAYRKPAVALPQSKIDSEKLKIAIMNLLENASNYTQAGHVIITLSYDKKNNENIFSIEDTGIGIPENDKNLLFTKFFKAANASKAEPGTGLGLFLVKNIIEKHGGKIWFDSTEGKGTTFYFTLPALKPSQIELLQKEKAEQTAQFQEFVKGI